METEETGVNVMMNNLGEIRAFLYLKSQGYIVEDLTDNPQFWE